MTDLRIGDRIKDNDPRTEDRVLTITELLPNGVRAQQSPAVRSVLILRRRIYTDGKPRRSGFTLLEQGR